MGIGEINPPEVLNSFVGAGGLSSFLNIIVAIIFTVASIIFLFMVILGAVQWITSGGEKEAISKARGRIVNAIIGLAILSLAFLIHRVLGDILGF